MKAIVVRNDDGNILYKPHKFIASAIKFIVFTWCNGTMWMFHDYDMCTQCARCDCLQRWQESYMSCIECGGLWVIGSNELHREWVWGCYIPYSVHITTHYTLIHSPNSPTNIFNIFLYYYEGPSKWETEEHFHTYIFLLNLIEKLMEILDKISAARFNWNGLSWLKHNASASLSRHIIA